MSRVKSQEELEREQADARYAQQLMEEERAAALQQQQQQASAAYAQRQQQEQQRYVQQHQPAQQQQYQTIPAHSALQVMCPTCMSLNNVHPANLHLQHMCGTCRRVLPNRADQLQSAQSGVLPSQQQQQQPAPRPQQQQTMTLRCQHCNADNIVPATGGAFKCGHCGNVLQSTLSSAPSQISVPHQQQTPPPQPQAQPQQRQVLQAQAIGNIEVRCGKCPAINNVPEDPRTPGTIQFRCGSCGALNRANY